MTTPDPIISAWKNFDPKNDEPFSNYDFMPWFQAAKTSSKDFKRFIDAEHKCNCSIQMLMREGCKCGGE